MRIFLAIPFVLIGLLQINASPSVPQKKAVPTKKKVVARKKAAPRLPPPVDPTIGDNPEGDDPEIRAAAIGALGTMNGSVVVVDPATGRILTMVNQRLALRDGFIPCSTIKLVTSLAALSEHVVDREARVPITRRVSYDMTTAIAHSNNQYFSILGKRLGFDRVTQYARMLGLGETAGLDIPGEEPGSIAPKEPPTGVGMMTSFGTGFEMTPLELAALLSAIANNGTLYYLQYPRSQGEIDQFVPKVKRNLTDLAPNGITDIKYGMRGAVDFGTARRANYDATEPIFGKTGTCTDFRASSHMGWFGSFNEVGHNQLVVVVMLAGNHAFSGPVAAGVAGAVYRKLSERRFFTADTLKKPTGLPEILTTYPTAPPQFEQPQHNDQR